MTHKLFLKLTALALWGCAISAPIAAMAQTEQFISEESPEFNININTENLEIPNDDAIQPLLPESETGSEALVEEAQEPIPAPPLQQLQAPNVPVIPAAANEDFDEDLFFDAEALVPSSDIARQGAPSKVNPALSPGSRLVVTRETASPDSKAARLTAAERAVKLGRNESALDIYDQLYADNARDPNILLGRATVLQRLGRDEEAVQAYEQLLDIRPANIEAQINLQGLIAKRYPAVARQNLLDLMQQHAGSVGIAAQLAVVEAKLGHYPDAIRFLGIAASIEPQNANHVYNMAVIADRAGDRVQAIQFYEEALEIDTLYSGGRTLPRENVFQRLAELR